MTVDNRSDDRRKSSSSSNSSFSKSTNTIIVSNKSADNINISNNNDREKRTKSAGAISVKIGNDYHTVIGADSLVTVDVNETSRPGLDNTETGLPVFPSLDDLQKFGANLMVRYRQLRTLIESKAHVAVEDYLQEHGTVVHGGSNTPTHMNIANCDGEPGEREFPLIAASRVDCEMVKLLLTYGANPNLVNTAGDSALSVAAARADEEMVNTLLTSGANLTIAIIKLTSALRFLDEGKKKLMDEDNGFSISALSMLVKDTVFVKCSNPIRTAFDVSRNIKEIIDVRHEFNIDLDRMIQDTDIFAYNLLNQCQKMWEAKLVLTDQHRLLQIAIDNKKKNFVSHPFSQQLIVEEWYGEIAYKLFWDKFKVAMRYLGSAFLIPIYTLMYVFSNKCGTKRTILGPKLVRQMDLIFTPFWCFITDFMNYLMLLGLLITVCCYTFKTPEPHFTEWVLWSCVVSRLLIERDQASQQGCWRYMTVWNLIEIVTCCLIAVGAIFRLVLWGTVCDTPIKFQSDLCTSYLIYITYINAVAEFFLILRWLNFLEIHSTLGPLMLAMKYMLEDVMKFVVVVLSTSVVGCAIAVYSICQAVRQNTGTSFKESFPFKDFYSTLTNVMWSTFGLLEMPGVKIESDDTSTKVIQYIMVVYVLIACVMMLNMLIAMLNIAYEHIHFNSDVEWKYAQAQLLKEYRNGQPFLFPFDLLLLPVTWRYRKILKRAKKRERLQAVDRKRERDRNVLMSILCERYQNNRLRQPGKQWLRTASSKFNRSRF